MRDPLRYSKHAARKPKNRERAKLETERLCSNVFIARAVLDLRAKASWEPKE
jgi:hypothetical protein